MEVAGSQISAQGQGSLLTFGGGVAPCEALVLSSGSCPSPGGKVLEGNPGVAAGWPLQLQPVILRLLFPQGL